MDPSSNEKPIINFTSLDHITLDDTEHVYEPSDDTFLMCDAIESDISFIKSHEPLIVVELGCGSGCVISYVDRLLTAYQIPAICSGLDINIKAAELTLKTAQYNQNAIDTILSNLASNYLPQSIDILIFNPPYVPTPSSEVHSGYLPPISPILPNTSHIIGNTVHMMNKNNSSNDIHTILDADISNKIVNTNNNNSSYDNSSYDNSSYDNSSNSNSVDNSNGNNSSQVAVVTVVREPIVGIEASWAGGIHGREVIDRFIPMMKILLRENGYCYLLLVQDNLPQQIITSLEKEGVYACHVVMRRQAKNEHLLVLRIHKLPI